MAIIETAIILLIASIFIGTIGSLLGIGGGVFLIPLMTLGLGIDIKVAAATSLVTIIVTSSTAASCYLPLGYVNVKLGVFLELFTVMGGLLGAFLAVLLDASIIEAVFGGLLIYTALYMILSKDISRRKYADQKVPDVMPGRYDGKCRDGCSNEMVEYHVKGLGKGAGAGCAAGSLSGLIGVGGGVVMVPAMNLWMGVPMRAATATSNFMIGVTAVASALVYLAGGLLAPFVTAVAAIGIFIGAKVGTKAMPKVRSDTLRMIFSFTILVIAVLMFLKAGGWL